MAAKKRAPDWMLIIPMAILEDKVDAEQGAEKKSAPHSPEIGAAPYSSEQYTMLSFNMHGEPEIKSDDIKLITFISATDIDRH